MLGAQLDCLPGHWFPLCVRQNHAYRARPLHLRQHCHMTHAVHLQRPLAIVGFIAAGGRILQSLPIPLIQRLVCLRVNAASSRLTDNSGQPGQIFILLANGPRFHIVLPARLGRFH